MVVRKMQRKQCSFFLCVLIMLGVLLGACSSNHDTESPRGVLTAENQNKTNDRTITYLGKNYVVPAKIDRIVVTGALEALEDAQVLDVKPVGAMTISGKFPAVFAQILQEAHPIGERMQPNFEEILKVSPDIILSSDKFPTATQEQLGKISTHIAISHFATDGDANLRLLGELSGKQELAEKIISQYHSEAAQAKSNLPQSLQNKKIIAVRLRVGNLNLYPANIFFNDILYGDLGLSVPEEIKAVKAQEIISLERLSEINPDYLFVMQAPGENPAHPRALEDLEENPIWQNIKAVQNKKVFVNVVDPLLQGVAIGGKMQFLRAATEKLLQ